MSRRAWIAAGVAALVLVALLLGLSQLKGCSLIRQERAIDAGVSAGLGARGGASTIETVRVAQEALASQRAANAVADNEARHDATAQTELPASVRARIASDDKRLCAKTNCN